MLRLMAGPVDVGDHDVVICAVERYCGALSGDATREAEPVLYRNQLDL